MGQPSHWTYRAVKDAEDLQQGDIIGRRPELLAVLSDVLSHFCDERYTAFVVLTQSCDLVERNGPCKAEYINLCVVRELMPLLPTLLESYSVAKVPGVFITENRHEMEWFLTRVINQNEQTRGLFYLHKDADAGIVTSSVALLRVSIALRRKHYGLLKDCRCGRLDAEYASKLGWLTGNLYSRIATADWEEREQDGQASRKQVQSLLRLVTSANDENWISAKVLRAAAAKKVDVATIPPDRFRSALEQYSPPELIEVVLDSVRRAGYSPMVGKAYVEVLDSISASDEFADEVTRQITASFADVLAPNEQVALSAQLGMDAEFRKSIAAQAALHFKQRMIEGGQQAIEDISLSLQDLVGLPSPAARQIQRLLASILQNQAEKRDQVAAMIAGVRPFSDAAGNTAQTVVRIAISRYDFALFDSLVARLRNDPSLRGACRSNVLDSSAVF